MPRDENFVRGFRVIDKFLLVPVKFQDDILICPNFALKTAHRNGNLKSLHGHSMECLFRPFTLGQELIDDHRLDEVVFLTRCQVTCIGESFLMAADRTGVIDRLNSTVYK